MALTAKQHSFSRGRTVILLHLLQRLLVLKAMSKTLNALHPRNPHQGRYDLQLLCQKHPALTPYITTTPAGLPSIDFSEAKAVQALNAALLATYYQVSFWQLPEGYLCPPIPGRADYIHYAADLVAELHNTPQTVPTGKQIRMLDIGCGANCIYAILASRSYGWQVVGSEVEQQALLIADTIVKANPALKGLIKLRLQPDAAHVLKNIILADDYFDLIVCNPPFYTSAAEALAVNQQKWQKLGKANQGRNFAGSGSELWCEGGELAFISKMIVESATYAKQVGWFSTLVSQQKHHKPLVALLVKQGKEPGKAQANIEIRQIKMQQGQKSSLMLAWRYTA